MEKLMNAPKIKLIVIALLALCSLALRASAGTYLTPTLDGSGSEWASVPIAINDAVDGVPIDVATVQIANDDNYIYFHVTFQVAVNPQSGSGLFLAIDNDNNTATGYDIFGLGAIGSDFGLQNDFPFEQATGVFNTGGGVTGGNGLIALYNTTVTEQEIAVSRAATFTASGNPVFPNNTIGVAFYSVDGAGDFAGTATYTFATVPEPSTLALAGIGLLMAVGFSAWRKKG
jgi:hypothetical protein